MTIRKPERSGFRMLTVFKWFWYLKVQYSDGYVLYCQKISNPLIIECVTSEPLGTVLFVALKQADKGYTYIGQKIIQLLI